LFFVKEQVVCQLFIFAQAAGLLLFYSFIIERTFMNSLRSVLR